MVDVSRIQQIAMQRADGAIKGAGENVTDLKVCAATMSDFAKKTINDSLQSNMACGQGIRAATRRSQLSRLAQQNHSVGSALTGKAFQDNNEDVQLTTGYLTGLKVVAQGIDGITPEMIQENFAALKQMVQDGPEAGKAYQHALGELYDTATEATEFDRGTALAHGAETGFSERGAPVEAGQVRSTLVAKLTGASSPIAASALRVATAAASQSELTGDDAALDAAVTVGFRSANPDVRQAAAYVKAVRTPLTTPAAVEQRQALLTAIASNKNADPQARAVAFMALGLTLFPAGRNDLSEGARKAGLSHLVEVTGLPGVDRTTVAVANYNIGIRSESGTTPELAAQSFFKARVLSSNPDTQANSALSIAELGYNPDLTLQNRGI